MGITIRSLIAYLGGILFIGTAIGTSSRLFRSLEHSCSIGTTVARYCKVWFTTTEGVIYIIYPKRKFPDPTPLFLGLPLCIWEADKGSLLLVGSVIIYFTGSVD